MRKTLALVLVALALPSIALAAKPTKSPTGHNGTAAGTVRYVLRGTLWSYVPATATDAGSVTIHVTGSNHHGSLLKGMDLTFLVAAKTKVAVASKSGLGTGKRHLLSIKDGTRGMIEFRGTLKLANSTLMTSLTSSSMTALAVFVRTR
jgi:hypothetical protein